MKLRFFGASIQWRVIYALAASLLWWVIVELNRSGSGETWSLPFYGTGSVYAALVLVPYLPDLKGPRLLRALALLLCGALSYWSAVSLFDSSIIPTPDFVKGLSGGLYLSYPMGLSGILGAAIVGIGARFLIPLAVRWSGWLMVLGAGLLGGVALGFAANAGAFVDDRITYLYWLPGHMAWQVLVCLALYYGSEHE